MGPAIQLALDQTTIDTLKSAPGRPFHRDVGAMPDAFAIPPVSILREPQDQSEPPVTVPIVGALLGTAVGLGAGAALYASSDCYEAECLSPVLTGLLIQAVAMPLGAHLGNGRRGNVGLDILTSVGTLAVGLGLAEAVAPRGVGGGTGVVVVAFIAQISATVVTERITGQNRDR